jgi:hypothetical protein
MAPSIDLTSKIVGLGLNCCSDLLALVKDFIIKPDVLVNLKTIKGLDQVTRAAGGVNIGGLITLDDLASYPLIRNEHTVPAEAVATPQIRNVGTLAGNVCQRPWCWYRSVELSCERLDVKFCDSHLDNTTQELFERLEVELRGVDNLLLVDTAWLACQDLRQRPEV